MGPKTVSRLINRHFRGLLSDDDLELPKPHTAKYGREAKVQCNTSDTKAESISRYTNMSTQCVDLVGPHTLDCNHTALNDHSKHKDMTVRTFAILISTREWQRIYHSMYHQEPPTGTNKTTSVHILMVSSCSLGLFLRTKKCYPHPFHIIILLLKLWSGNRPTV